jgi:hypothetical protein
VAVLGIPEAARPRIDPDSSRTILAGANADGTSQME